MFGKKHPETLNEQLAEEARSYDSAYAAASGGTALGNAPTATASTPFAQTGANPYSIPNLQYASSDSVDDADSPDTAPVDAPPRADAVQTPPTFTRTTVHTTITAGDSQESSTQVFNTEPGSAPPVAPTAMTSPTAAGTMFPPAVAAAMASAAAQGTTATPSPAKTPVRAAKSTSDLSLKSRGFIFVATILIGLWGYKALYGSQTGYMGLTVKTLNGMTLGVIGIAIGILLLLPLQGVFSRKATKGGPAKKNPLRATGSAIVGVILLLCGLGVSLHKVFEAGEDLVAGPQTAKAFTVEAHKDYGIRHRVTYEVTMQDTNGHKFKLELGDSPYDYAELLQPGIKKITYLPHTETMLSMTPSAQ